MNSSIQRVCLAVLAVTGAYVGVWAYFAPMHWYGTFPGFGMQWLPVLGPYNEHFAKDVGALYLALTTLSAVTFFHVGNRTLVLVTSVSYSMFNLLHLIYHVPMLHMYDTRNAALNAVSLALVLLCSAVLVVPDRLSWRVRRGSRVRRCRRSSSRT